MEIVIFLLVLGYCFYFMNKVKNRSNTDVALTGNEKLQVIITEFLNPVVAGAIYYYGWRKKLPQKANQANSYSWRIVGGMLVFAVVIIILSLIFGWDNE